MRAIASYKLSKLAARAKTAVNKTELDTAQRQLLAADIKRFLERPLDLGAAVPARDARRASRRADRRHAAGLAGPSGGLGLARTVA